MPDTDIAAELARIRAVLAVHQKDIDDLKDRRPEPLPKIHWKIQLALAAVVLIVGSLMAYEYGQLLTSITDQIPR
jgi:hypothetical protein